MRQFSPPAAWFSVVQVGPTTDDHVTWSPSPCVPSKVGPSTWMKTPTSPSTSQANLFAPFCSSTLLFKLRFMYITSTYNAKRRLLISYVFLPKSEANHFKMLSLPLAIVLYVFVQEHGKSPQWTSCNKSLPARWSKPHPQTLPPHPHLTNSIKFHQIPEHINLEPEHHLQETENYQKRRMKKHNPRTPPDTLVFWLCKLYMVRYVVFLDVVRSCWTFIPCPKIHILGLNHPKVDTLPIFLGDKSHQALTHADFFKIRLLYFTFGWLYYWSKNPAVGTIKTVDTVIDSMRNSPYQLLHQNVVHQHFWF